MLGAQLVHQRTQLRERCRDGKEFLLLRRKVNGDLQFKLLLDFRLPGGEVWVSGLKRAVQTHTQRQRVLVLARQRDQARVTQHAGIIAFPGTKAKDADWRKRKIRESALSRGRGLSLPILKGPLKGKRWLVATRINFFLGTYEVEQTEAFVKTVVENDVVYDCGAHYGYYTLLASTLAKNGKVFAFEPSPANLVRLRRSLGDESLRERHRPRVGIG